jgi:hypothetical protein
MSRLSLFAVALVLSCKGATPPPKGGGNDAAAAFWPTYDTAATEAQSCGESHSIPFQLRLADVLLVFDRSDSMSTEFSTGTRYSVSAAMLAGLVDTYQDKLRFGFQAFPDARACPAGQAPGCCAGGPTVGVHLSSGAEIRAAIAAAQPPGGSTPTAEALRRAREYYATLDDGVPDRYVLLSTDGQPSCDGAGRLGQADVLGDGGTAVAGACHDALEEVDRLVAAGVELVVLGVGSNLPDDPGGSPGCLEEIARRGRGVAMARPEDRPWYYSGTDQDGLEMALQQIFGGVIQPPCSLVLDAAPPDPRQVAVLLDGHQVPHNRNYGWEYDSPDDTRQIHFYGEYCTRIQRFQVSSIDVRWGCPPCPDPRQCE